MSHIKIRHKRHILKTITWRIVATLATILIVLAFTGNLELSLGAGGVEIIIKMILYYLHERIWYRYDIGIVDKDKRTHKD